MKQMKSNISLTFAAFLCGCALGLIGSEARVQAQQNPPAVEALLYSTMPSKSDHRPTMAMDGDPKTYFRSAYGMGDGDDFLVLLSQPIPVQDLRITTGDDEDQEILTEGFVETSADAVHYSKAAIFDSKGVADAVLENKPVQAIRIRLNRNTGIPTLLIREITIHSTVKINHIQEGPGRGFVDLSEAPDLADWAKKAEQQMEAFWPDTEALLYTDRFIPPNAVNVVYRTGPGVTDVAATGGGVMTVNSRWCRAHPEDTGLAVHEMAHVIQAFSAYNPVWLVEGIADYIRWVKFEPEHYRTQIDVRTATYHDSYRTTASFLGWCELHYDSRLVTKLNQNVRFGTYKNDLFKQYCGKDVDTLWQEFVAAYQADPANIITPLIPAAERPRTLPTVKAGSSVSVDLIGAFNAMGIFQDGATYQGARGLDGEGAGYSAALLGKSVTWKDVVFTIGPANGQNVVTCRGNTIALPSGNYSSLWLLGAAVEGSQMAQTLTVNYTDGASEILAQNFSDWFEPQRAPGESTAVKMAYRNTANGGRDTRTFYVYSYGFHLNNTKTVKSLTLPNNINVKLLAITLAN